jgi:flavoprotein
VAPDGRVVKIKTREVDLKNVQLLREMDGVTILSSIESIKDRLHTILS